MAVTDKKQLTAYLEEYLQFAIAKEADKITKELQAELDERLKQATSDIVAKTVIRVMRQTRITDLGNELQFVVRKEI